MSLVEIGKKVPASGGSSASVLLSIISFFISDGAVC